MGLERGREGRRWRQLRPKARSAHRLQASRRHGDQGFQCARPRGSAGSPGSPLQGSESQERSPRHQHSRWRFRLRRTGQGRSSLRGLRSRRALRRPLRGVPPCPESGFPRTDRGLPRCPRVGLRARIRDRRGQRQNRHPRHERGRSHRGRSLPLAARQGRSEDPPPDPQLPHAGFQAQLGIGFTSTTRARPS